jgi:hypothetical protein
MDSRREIGRNQVYGLRSGRREAAWGVGVRKDGSINNSCQGKMGQDAARCKARALEVVMAKKREESRRRRNPCSVFYVLIPAAREWVWRLPLAARVPVCQYGCRATDVLLGART